VAALPGRPDRRPGPARAETAAIVAPAVKARTTEIVPVAHVPVHWRIVRLTAVRAVDGDVRVRRLMVARQEAVAMPAMQMLLLGGRGERDGRCDRQQKGKGQG